MIASRSINSGQRAKWQSTTAPDLDAIEKIANVVHPAMSERLEVFAEKLNLFPEGCFVLEQDNLILAMPSFILGG